MKYVFKSCLADRIVSYIRLNHTLGFKIYVKTHYLKTIDKAAFNFSFNSFGITKEFADYYSQLDANESLENRYHRVRTLRLFSIYLNDNGIESFVPDIPRLVQKPFTPYIYSQSEVNSIFATLDNYRMPTKSMGKSMFFIYPTLFRLLYATGLRIGEALDLRLDDVDLIEKNLIVRISKNGKERILPIRDSLTEVLMEYRKNRNALCRNSYKSPYFFIRLDGKKVTREMMDNSFPRILADSGLGFKGRSKSPRVHDFRHTFAVTALNQIIKSGIEHHDILPILAAYLGHTKIESTQKYLRLSDISYASLLAYPLDNPNNIFPSVDENENYED